MKLNRRNGKYIFIFLITFCLNMFMQNVFAVDSSNTIDDLKLVLQQNNVSCTSDHMCYIQQSIPQELLFGIEGSSLGENDSNIYVYSHPVNDALIADLQKTLFEKPVSGFLSISSLPVQNKLSVSGIQHILGKDVVNFIISYNSIEPYIIAIAQYKGGAGNNNKADYFGKDYVVGGPEDLFKKDNYEFDYLILVPQSNEMAGSIALYNINNNIVNFFCKENNCLPSFVSIGNLNNVFNDIKKYTIPQEKQLTTNSTVGCPEEYKQVDPLLCNFTLYDLSKNGYLKKISDAKQEAINFLGDSTSNFNKYFNGKQKYLYNKNTDTNNLFDKVTNIFGLSKREKAIIFANNMGESRWYPPAKGQHNELGLSQINVSVWANASGYNQLKIYINNYCNNANKVNFCVSSLDDLKTKYLLVNDLMEITPDMKEKALVLSVALNDIFAKSVDNKFFTIMPDSPLQINKDFLTFYIYRTGSGTLNNFTTGIPLERGHYYSSSANCLNTNDAHVLCTSLQRLGWYLGYLEYVNDNL